ncbi:hypothetical protein QBC47DRAFT_173652 [Echria macrotheca]|uniref:Zn(2)-C6 fungal-type domain-containing protein n=1 Tax=Echria macrotheca TaxID=438768 RepID=A0AAJ0BEU7_9PEZI|nr:hypothetical protein QBC47DRAFT_173652 [Echria macrotheca]
MTGDTATDLSVRPQVSRRSMNGPDSSSWADSNLSLFESDLPAAHPPLLTAGQAPRTKRRLEPNADASCVSTNKLARRFSLQDAVGGSGYQAPGYYLSSSAMECDTTTSPHGFGNGPAVTDAYVTNSTCRPITQLPPLNIRPYADFTFPSADVQQVPDGLPPTPQTPSNATQTPYLVVFPGNGTAISSFEYTNLYAQTPLEQAAHHGLPCDSAWDPPAVPPETNQREFQLLTSLPSSVYTMRNQFSSPNHQLSTHEHIPFPSFPNLLSPDSFMENPGVIEYQIDATTPVFLDEATVQTNHRNLSWQHGRIIKNQSPSPPNPLSPPRSSLDTPTPKVEPPDEADRVAACPLIPTQSGRIVRTPRLVADDGASMSSRPTGQPQTPRRRGPIAEGERKIISETRKLGACIRCHLQRARCVVGPDGPLGTCGTCMNVNRRSKKTIHHLPCLRFKLTTVKYHRTADAGLTKRFTNTQVVDIEAFGPVKTIKIGGNAVKTPLELQVREFAPLPGDQLGRWYKDSKGIMRNVQKSAFCLADIEKAAAAYVGWVDLNVYEGLELLPKPEHPIIRETFLQARHHTEQLVRGHVQDSDSTEQRNFMIMAIRLWFSIRHCSGSSYLVGDETLGIELVEDEDCEWRHEGRCVPRMIVAQFDSIRIERVYKKKIPNFLKLYEKILKSGNMHAWFTIYLVTFLFVDLVAIACRDVLRRRRQQGWEQETRYGPSDLPSTSFMEEVQAGGVTMLAHWLYFRRVDLLNTDWDNLEDSPWKALTPEQIDFMRRTVTQLKRIEPTIPKTPSEGCWESSLFWFSQMFAPEWNPPQTFTRAMPSAGREE